MSEELSKEKLIGMLLEERGENISYEEAIHLLMSYHNQPREENASFGMRAAEKIAGFAGSWWFVLIYMAILAIWMCVNIFFTENPFDPYPFILLNLVLSCVSSFQAPLIMMSQNQQAKRERYRAYADHRIHLKNELIIEDIHRKLDEVMKREKGEKNDDEQKECTYH